MFAELTEINRRPELYEVYTADGLWTDEYIAQRMLEYHVDPDGDIASRSKAKIEAICSTIIQRFSIGAESDVLDLGCGPGLYSTYLARAGAKVTGIDFSENSIRYARAQAEAEGLSIHYLHRDYLTWEAEQKYDLASLIYYDLCALTSEQRKLMLKKIHDLLKPEGHFILDVFSDAMFDAAEEKRTYEFIPGNGFWAGGAHYLFLNGFLYKDERVTLDKYTIIEPDRTRVIYNWLKYFNPQSLTAELEEAGFKVLGIQGDLGGADYDPTSIELAAVAKP